MNIEIISQEKGVVELRLDNSTAAEVLRMYLVAEGVDFAAWRKEHPTKPLVMRVQDANVKKIIASAVAKIKSDGDELIKGLK